MTVENDDSITLSDTEITFQQKKGSEITITVNASGSWRITEMPDDWLEASQGRNAASTASSVTLHTKKENLEFDEIADHVLFECGEAKATLNVKQLSKFRKDVQAEPMRYKGESGYDDITRTTSYGLSTFILPSNAAYFYYKIFRKEEFEGIKDFSKNVENLITGTDWVKETEAQDFHLYTDTLKPNATYYLVTVPFSREQTIGIPFNKAYVTKNTNDQPRAEITVNSRTSKAMFPTDDDAGRNRTAYKWKVKLSGAKTDKYYVYACAGSEPFTSYNVASQQPEPERRGAMLTGLIFREIKMKDGVKSHSTELNGKDVHDYLYLERSGEYEYTLEADEDDKYLEIAVWCVKENGEFSGLVCDSVYTVNNGIVSTAQITKPNSAVDLGLPSGTKWADMNVGANAPEDYGFYFAWGETRGYHEKYNGRKFNWESYAWAGNSEHSLTKYCNDAAYGKTDNKTELDLSDDAARANWGEPWRMPNADQVNELLQYTSKKWTMVNEVEGCRFTSTINGKSIFLPAAGYRYNAEFREKKKNGYFWSSSLYPSKCTTASGFYFIQSGMGLVSYDLRCCGFTVRPVMGK